MKKGLSTLPNYEQGVCHIVALPFTLKTYLKRQKKNCGNSNISPSKKYNLQKKTLKENQKSFKLLLTL
jgi:hypothetical protein